MYCYLPKFAHGFCFASAVAEVVVEEIAVWFASFASAAAAEGAPVVYVAVPIVPFQR